MQLIDWLVLVSTLAFIAIYGMWKSRKERNIDQYLLADKTMPWYVVGISVMATQASAITFLSAPGQAFTDGMRFVQFYFGLPLAMIILCITFIPIYHRLNVYTAYELLEKRFDLKTRALTALLFLIQRGIACGLTIYAPALILSSLLGWNIYWTNFITGSFVVLYTVAGGSKAVSITQVQQMAVIFIGMIIGAFFIIHLLPENVSVGDSLRLAGKLGKLNTIDLKFDVNNQYTVWSGLIGGFFLALSYFGTDQSQVSRYLSGRSIGQSRLGLLMNAVVKIPMQFGILLIGIFLFSFYQFHRPPLNFNNVALEKLKQSSYHADYVSVEQRFDSLHKSKNLKVTQLMSSFNSNADDDKIITALKEDQKAESVLRKETAALIRKADPAADTNDTNYIFLNFVTNYFPAGLIGLLIAVILCASMSSTSSELNALASTTVVDIYKRMFRAEASNKHYVNASRLITILWGAYAILVAMFANRMGSLIEAVNKLGSLFYGTILGIFIIAFYIKRIKGHAVFYAALLAEAVVIICYMYDVTAFLWLNLIGSVMVVVFSFLLQMVLPDKKTVEQADNAFPQ